MATIVGETTLIKGNLEGDEDLNVRGRVEGAVNLTSTLLVEPSGIVKAEVSVQNCVVSGVVVGNITATDAIELTAEARVVGDLTAPRVIVVDGASFRGRVDMGDLEMERPRGAVAAPAARGATAALARAGAPAPTRTATPTRAAPPPPPRRRAAEEEETVTAPAARRASKKAPASPPRPSKKKKKVKVRKKTKKR